MQLEIAHFTDPVCPFAFSAEPVRLRLRWRYGEQLRWRNRMIVLAPELGRRAKPESVQELLAWADAPLASSEVSAIAELEPAEARAQCARVGRPIAAGADCYWTLQSA